MAKRLDDSIFKQASTQAMQTALDQTVKDRLRIMKDADFVDILEKLKQTSVDKAEITVLKSVIDQATDKNEALLSVLEKGGALAKAVIDIIKKR